MTAHIGPNHRLSVARTLKTETRALYQGVFGAAVDVLKPDLEIFRFANGSNIGVYYVDPAEALTPEQHMNAIWLEFEVDDERAAAASLEKIGMRPFDYADKTHLYFQAPGGQVFRLAGKRK